MVMQMTFCYMYDYILLYSSCIGHRRTHFGGEAEKTSLNFTEKGRDVYREGSGDSKTQKGMEGVIEGKHSEVQIKCIDRTAVGPLMVVAVGAAAVVGG